MKPSRPPSTEEFSTYPPKKLLLLWKNGEVTAEQMVGYLTLNLIDYEERLLRLERGAPPNPDRSAPESTRT